MPRPEAPKHVVRESDCNRHVVLKAHYLRAATPLLSEIKIPVVRAI